MRHSMNGKPRKSLITIGGIIFGLLIAEGLSRVYLWQSRRAAGGAIHDYFYFDERGEFRIRPRASGWHRGYNAGPVMVQVNSLGFRGNEVRGKPERRVIIVGDSIVFDGGVALEKTFVSLLENRFRKDGRDVEIINAGTTDVGVDQYLLQVKSQRVLNLKPDAVVVGLYLNDSRPPQGHLGEEKKTLVLKFLALPGVKNLAIARLLRDAHITYQFRRGTPSFTQRFDWVHRSALGRWKTDLPEFKKTVWEARFDWGAAWGTDFDHVVFPALREIRDWSLKHGMAVAVLIFPVALQVQTELTDPYIKWPQHKVMEFAKSEQIPALDLLPVFQRYREKNPLADQCHLNETGNEIAANYLYPFLTEILGQSKRKSS